MKRSKSLLEYFWLRVEKGPDCWSWSGRRDPFGYGVVQLGLGKPRTGAHRASWEIHNGPLPQDEDKKRGTCVLHKCDNPACVRPDHLFLGTRADNSHDAQRKGRLNIPEKGWLRNRTHCPNGHLFDESNTYLYRGARLCRACRVINQREHIRRKREKAVHGG